MELSFFLAKFIGIYMLIITFIWFLRKNQMEHYLKQLFSLEYLIVFSGFFALLAGLAIVIGHPVWEWSWRLLITLLGCLAILRGVMRLAFPAVCHKILLKSLRHSHWILLILLILGVYLTYHGFVNAQFR